MKRNGFTLIELLIVLSITSVLTLVGGRLSFTALHKQYEQQFLNTLTEDIRYIQNLSISDVQTDARIVLQPHQYFVTSNTSTSSDYKRELPKGWRIEPRNLRIIMFNSNGTLRQSGTVFIHSPHTKFKVVFPLGKGSYYVSE